MLRGSAWTVLVCTFVLACTGGPPDDGTSPNPRGSEFPPPDPLPEKYTACELDADCVIVQLGCCDHCNGGLAVAVSATARDDVVDRYTERCRPRQGCTLVGCPNVRARCDDQGSCDAVQDTGF